MRLRTLLSVLFVLPVCLAARADTFSYTLNGGSSGFSGTGTLMGDSVSPGAYLITSMTGTGVTSLISPGAYGGNDNLLFPTSTPIFDAAGLSFIDQNSSGVYQVNLHSVGVNYFATVTDNSNTTSTVPVEFSLTTAVTPEPSSLALLGTGVLGAVGVARRHVAARCR